MHKRLVLFFCSVLLLGTVALFSAFVPPASAMTAQAEGATAHLNSSQSLSCPTLSLGSTGSVVKTLQGKLNYLYERYSDPRWFENWPDDFKPPLAVDGIFGRLTRNAVIDYQTWNGLQVDGIVGPQTWRSLGGC
jgi:peptidoglycan hydrolase-like protein with peptidoglycan-binding domain